MFGLRSEPSALLIRACRSTTSKVDLPAALTRAEDAAIFRAPQGSNNAYRAACSMHTVSGPVQHAPATVGKPPLQPTTAAQQTACRLTLTTAHQHVSKEHPPHPQPPQLRSSCAQSTAWGCTTCYLAHTPTGASACCVGLYRWTTHQVPLVLLALPPAQAQGAYKITTPPVVCYRPLAKPL